MITILNYRKNKKITVQPDTSYLEQQAHVRSVIASVPEVWQADSSSIDDIVSVLVELQTEGSVKQTRQGRYVLTSKGLNYNKKNNL